MTQRIFEYRRHLDSRLLTFDLFSEKCDSFTSIKGHQVCNPRGGEGDGGMIWMDAKLKQYNPNANAKSFDIEKRIRVDSFELRARIGLANPKESDLIRGRKGGEIIYIGYLERYLEIKI